MGAVLVNLRCLTNLHVGNGEVNYNIVDNEVERDPVTGFPTINSSGVKGALRSYFKTKGCPDLEKWFGSDPTEKQNHKQGALRILNANMLAMPLRATAGDKSYHLVYAEDMKEQFENLCQIFGFTPQVTPAANAPASVAVEGFTADQPIQAAGQILYHVKGSELKKVSLPVIARNYLENGKSSNLWYEEVVPHESLFYFFVTSDNEAALKAFATAMKSAGVIQFGGNATIGYGLCSVTVQEA